MSKEAELHLLKLQVENLEDKVKDIDFGLTKKERKLRDEFAMAALSKLEYTPWDISEMAKEAYVIADAMLVARGE